MIPGLSTVKLIGGLVAALILLSLIAERSRWMHRAHAAEAQVSADCKAARGSANNPKMACDQTDEQISFLGEAITALSNAIRTQNIAVASLGAASEKQQANSAKASQAAQERAKTAQAAATRLEASSRAGEAQAKPCEPSKTLTGAWK